MNAKQSLCWTSSIQDGCDGRARPRRAGFNCAEAVNFGPPDWLPFGSDRAHKYRDDAKPLTLSHDALLVTLVGAN